jgi:hypothetical protein
MSGATTLALFAPAAALLTGVALACGSSDPSPSPSPSYRFPCSPDINDIPFIEELTLPAHLPKGLTLANACHGGNESVATDAEFFYASDNGRLLVVVLTGQGVPVEQNGRTTIQLGDLVGYVSNEAEADGTSSYSVEFEKEVRSYGVGAILGPTNSITADDVNAVALSIAEN